VSKIREELLGEALFAVLVRIGVLSVDSAPTGPELLVAAESYVESRQVIPASGCKIGGISAGHAEPHIVEPVEVEVNLDEEDNDG